MLSTLKYLTTFTYDYSKQFLKRGFEFEITRKLWNDIEMPSILKFVITFFSVQMDLMIIMIGILALMWPLLIVVAIMKTLGIE